MMFSLKSKPHTPILHGFLAHNLAKYEAIFIGRSDDGQVCPVTMANRAGIAPFPSCDVENEII